MDIFKVISLSTLFFIFFLFSPQIIQSQTTNNIDTGIQLFETKKYPEAKKFFESYTKAKQKDPLGAYYLGRLFLRDGNYDKAIDWLEKAVEAYIERVDRFSDIPGQVAMLFDFSPPAMGEEERKELKAGCTLKVIRLFGDRIAGIERFSDEKFDTIAIEIKKETGCKGRDLYHPLRLALTARSSGLDLHRFIALVEEGAQLDFPKPLRSCSQRVSEMLTFLKDSGFYKEGHDDHE